MPIVSIVMPMYNTGKYIRETIDSLLEQTFTDFEIIVIDDCSTDDSVNIVKSYNDSRIRIMPQKEKSSIPKLRNIGIDAALGKYIALMDSDDIAPAYRLQEQVDYLEQNLTVDVLSGDYQCFGESGAYISHPAEDVDIRTVFFFYDPITNPAVMFRKKSLQGIRYDEKQFVCSDYGLFANLLGICNFHNLTGKPYLHYRVGHSQSITNSTTKTSEKFLKRKAILLDIQKTVLQNLKFKVSDEDLACLPIVYEYHATMYLNGDFGFYTERDLANMTDFFEKLISQISRYNLKINAQEFKKMADIRIEWVKSKLVQ